MKKPWSVSVSVAALMFAALMFAAGRARADALPSRSVWVAPTYQVLLTGAFRPSSRHGVGASAAYEFHISPVFNIGLALAYRLYPGARATHQVGYGTTLKHFFSAAWSSRDGVFPYADYGLLLQQTYVEGRGGSAVAHDTRVASLPEVPTMREAGHQDVVFSQWYAIFARAGTPAATIDRLNQAMKGILAKPDVRTAMATQGAEPAYTTPEELTQFCRSEITRFRAIIQRLGIKAG